MCASLRDARGRASLKLGYVVKRVMCTEPCATPHLCDRVALAPACLCFIWSGFLDAPLRLEQDSGVGDELFAEAVEKDERLPKLVHGKKFFGQTSV